LGLGVRG
jgi:hypothetical protein